MIPLLAETAPPDSAAWMTNLSFLVTITLAIVTLIANLLNRRQRRSVAFEVEYALKADLDRLEKSLHEFKECIEHMRRDMVEMQREAQRAGEARAAAMHDRMNGVSEELTRAVGEIRGELKHFSRTHS